MALSNEEKAARRRIKAASLLRERQTLAKCIQVTEQKLMQNGALVLNLNDILKKHIDDVTQANIIKNASLAKNASDAAANASQQLEMYKQKQQNMSNVLNIYKHNARCVESDIRFLTYIIASHTV
jgi:hypothetical protein